MRKISFFVAVGFVLSSFWCFAAKDSTRIDSLRAELSQSKEDTNKYRIYEALGQGYLFFDYDSAQFFHYRGLELAESLNNKALQVNSLIDIANSMGQGDQDSLAIITVAKAIEIAKEIDDISQLARAYYHSAYSRFKLKQLDKSRQYAEKAIEEAKKVNNYEIQLFSNNTLGVIYLTKSRTVLGMKHLVEAQKNIEKGDLDPDAVLCCNIARCYKQLKNYEKATEYFQKSLDIIEESNETYIKPMIYSQLMAMALDAKNFEKAKTHLDSYQNLLAQSNANLERDYHYYAGTYHQALQNIDAAIVEYRKSIALFPASLPVSDKISSHYKLAQVLFNSSNGDLSILKEATKNAELAYKYSVELNAPKQIGSAAGLLFKIYKALKNNKKAVYYGEINMQIRDSLFSEERIKAMTDVQDKYEAEKRELEIEILTQETELQEADLSKSRAEESSQRKITIISISGLGLSILLALFLFRLYNEKKKGVIVLEEKNVLISEQKEEKELLLKEIHHRVKNNLQVVSSLLDLQTQNINDESTLTAIEDGQSRVQAMALIHQNLYQNQDVSSVSFEDYANQLINQLCSVYETKDKINIELVSNETYFDIDTAIPLGLILNELISNSFKYAFKDRGQGNLSIVLKEIEQGEFSLSIKDNGGGLPNDFDVKKTKSLGLRLVHRLSRQLYGNMEYSYDQGAVFIIQFKDTLKRKLVQ